jgi:two-component system, sensor histidine kinase and response regulator
MPEKIKILYVDDESNNLVSFRSYFRKDYEVHIATSASEALEFLETTPVEVIISDQRMPSTTGVEFFEKTIQTHPDSVRILLTAQTDVEIVIQAINQGQITKFVQKPWNWEKLALTIENCIVIYKSRQEIKQKNDELQKTNDELNKFVYSVSHDLRSPLMSILGLVHLAKTQNDKNIENTYFEMIEGCINKLDAYIKNIIDYYKNARGEEEIKEPIEFRELVESVFESLENQDNAVVFELDVKQKEAFFGDVFRLRVALSNLVSNAIKYKNPKVQKSFVKINVDVSEDFASIQVIDNGIGILKEHLGSIFKLFFRTENSKDKDGSGIGLYIVKEAIEKMGGNILVESTPLLGSSFEINIPNKK